jgi:hypothetical protein
MSWLVVQWLTVHCGARGIRREPRLFVCGNGQGSPCLDLRRVPETLADATVGTDLVIIEGMGRAIHTNYRCLSTPWISATVWLQHCHGCTQKAM